MWEADYMALYANRIRLLVVKAGFRLTSGPNLFGKQFGQESGHVSYISNMECAQKVFERN